MTVKGSDIIDGDPNEESKVKFCNVCTNVMTQNIEYIQSQKERHEDIRTSHETKQTTNEIVGPSAIHNKKNSDINAMDETLVWNNTDAFGGKDIENKAASYSGAGEKTELEKPSFQDTSNKQITSHKNATVFKYLKAQSKASQTQGKAKSTVPNPISKITMKFETKACKNVKPLMNKTSKSQNRNESNYPNVD